MSNFSMRVGDDGTVYFGGDMNLFSTPGMYREFESRFNDQRAIGNINLGGVRHADSSGLALLLEWQAMSSKLDRQLHITEAPASLLRLAKLCEADHQMDISGRDDDPI